MRKGRREEFKAAYAAFGDNIPDPLLEETFRAAVLDWDARSSPSGRERLALVSELLAIRRREIAPHLPAARFGTARCTKNVLMADWPLGKNRTLILLANLCDRAAELPAHFRCGRPDLGRRARGQDSPLGGVLEHRRALMPAGVPLATYRVQLTARFGFDQAAEAVPYLHALGISHLYASPFLKARAGSNHGYDVVDYGRLNPELGGEAAFERLCGALDQAGIGLILDFVPNHMAVHFADNAWWLDVLEWGPASPYAAAFDIDWHYFPGRPQVLLPILGAPYGEALDKGEIELRYDAAEGSFSAWYYEHRLPIAPTLYGEILQTMVVQTGASEDARRLAALGLGRTYRRARIAPGRNKRKP